MIYFIYPNSDIWEYMVAGIDIKNAACRPLNPSCNNLQLACRKLFNKSRLPGFMLFGGRMLRELRALGDGDTVLLADYIDVCLFRSIQAIVRPSVRLCLWVWNPVKEAKRTEMKSVYAAITQAGFEISTFDKGDANRYQQRLLNQFFRMKQSLSDARPKYDFYFVGFEKNRGMMIRELKEILQGYRSCFKVVRKVSEVIPYSENIANIAQARCVIDIVQNGQTGITLRPLEALALRKKLITNNRNILNYDFYDPSNIFILGVDDIAKLDVFLNTEFKPISSKVISKYDIMTWLSNFVNR